MSKILAAFAWLFLASAAFGQSLGPVPGGGGGSGGTPGGSNTQVQYNNSGAFGGITGATTDGTALTLVAPVLGTPASGTLTNATGLPISTGVSGLGTGAATALGVNVGAAGAFVTNGGALGTPLSGVATNLTGTASGLTAGNVTTNANLTGDVTSVGNATTLTNAPVIAKVLTGYTSGAGTVSATDSILQAFQKINGNDALKLPLAGGTLTGNLLFSADNTLDIGASGATRPRNIFVANNITLAGSLVASTDISAGGTRFIGFTGRSFIQSSADGNLTLENNANTAFGLLQFGGTTTSFPAIKRTTTTLAVRLADDSADTGLSAGNFTASGAAVIFNGLATDAAATDTTLCSRSSDGTVLKGSGTLGICLGTSSIRYKSQIHDIAVGLPEIMALPAKSFYLDASHGDPNKLMYGFTAEDCARVLPTLTGLDTEDRPNTCDYLGVVPVLVKAIQQQQAQIEELKRRQ